MEFAKIYERTVIMDHVLADVTKTVQTYPKVTMVAAAGLIFYSGLATMIPARVSGLFDSTAFRVLVLLLAVAMAKYYSITAAMLVGIVYAVSMSTLSRYRTFAMADSVGVVTAGHEQGSSELNGLPAGDTSVTRFSSNGPHHSVTIRGHTYDSVDGPSVPEPTGVVPSESDGLEPYVGGLLSPIDGADSQL